VGEVQARLALLRAVSHWAPVAALVAATVAWRRLGRGTVLPWHVGEVEQIRAVRCAGHDWVAGRAGSKRQLLRLPRP
jgi:hypothetical protein